MINIQKDAKSLLAQIHQAGLSKDMETPIDPQWLRERFPKDIHGLELNLHIMTWQGLLQHWCQEITEASKQDVINYDLINRDAHQIQIIDDIKAKYENESNHGHFYFDTSAPLDKFSSYLTYGEIFDRASEYRKPKEVE